MTETEWEALMRSARLTAGQRNERVRVVAGKARGRWLYVITCGGFCLVCRPGQSY